MKIKMAKDNKYRIETVITIPKDMLKLYDIIETCFSPNPYDPIISYELPRMNLKIPLQNLIDYILDREHRLV